MSHFLEEMQNEIFYASANILGFEINIATTFVFATSVIGRDAMRYGSVEVAGLCRLGGRRCSHEHRGCDGSSHSGRADR